MRLESDAVLLENTAIAERLRSIGVPQVELINNPLGEPIAVHLPTFYDTNSGVIPSKLEHTPIPSSSQGWDDEVMQLRSSFPMVYNMMQPPQILGLIDTVVQVVTGDDVLATELTEWDYVRAVGNSGLHIDYSSFLEGTELPISGRNVHLTPGNGAADVKMGLLRDFNYMAVPVARREEYLRKNGQPFAEFSLQPGDVVIFPGGGHPAREILPVAHEFTAQGLNRVYDLYIPSVDNRAKVLATRGELIQKHDLYQIGYTTQPSPIRRSNPV